MSSRYDKVLIAIDGSDASQRILEYAGDLAAIHGSEVVVFHVHQLAYAGMSTMHVGGPVDISAEDAAADLRKTGIDARALEEEAYWGHTADAIVDAATREGAKAIVIGTRGRGKTTAVLVGSVAYKVLHLAQLPVLVIP